MLSGANGRAGLLYDGATVSASEIVTAPLFV